MAQRILAYEEIKPQDYHANYNLFRNHYPLLFVIPIIPMDSHFHTHNLLKAKAPEEIAYHIIALGILGEDTTEVQKSLEYARNNFGSDPVPLHFDWPDLLEQFRQALIIDPNLTVANYPGNRDFNFNLLIDECYYRIHNKELFRYNFHVYYKENK